MNTDERLAVIETKIDNITEVLHDRAAQVDKVSDRHDIRILSLERFRNIAIGVIIVISGGMGAAWRFIL